MEYCIRRLNALWAYYVEVKFYAGSRLLLWCVFHTRPSDRSAGLCGSGRWVCDWGSITGLDMTGAVWRLWLGGLGASCYWGKECSMCLYYKKSILFWQDHRNYIACQCFYRDSPAACLKWIYDWHGMYFSLPEPQWNKKSCSAPRSTKHTAGLLVLLLSMQHPTQSAKPHSYTQTSITNYISEWITLG